MSKETIEKCLKNLISSGDKKTLDNVIELLLAVKDFERSPKASSFQQSSNTSKPKLMTNMKKTDSKKIDENVSHETIDPTKLPIEQYAGLLMDGLDETKKYVPKSFKDMQEKGKITEELSDVLNYADALMG